MKPSTVFRYQAIEPSGVVSGAMAHFRQGRTNGVVFTDKELKIPARNPYPANSSGRIVLYMPVGEEYEVTIMRPDGVQIEQFIHTALPAGGTVIERVSEPVVREVAAPETVARLEEAERKLTAAQAELAKRELIESMVEDEGEPINDEPPAGIADLFRPDRPYAEQAHALWKKYNELTNKIMMKLATDDELTKHERLQGELDWIKRHVFEGI